MGYLTSIAERQLPRLRDLEGRRVSLTLADGSRIDDVTIVSCGRGGVSSVWLDVDGMDVFIHNTQIVGAAAPQPPKAA